MTLRLLFTTLLLLVTAACSREESPAESTAAPQAAAEAAPEVAAAPAGSLPPAPAGSADLPEDWDPAARALAEELAAKLRAAGTPCDEYDVIPFGMYASDYVERLKMPLEDLPLTEAYCLSTEEEDLTFAIFASREKAERFVERKRRLLCRRAKETKLADFPGFPYVIHDRWVIQPDERVTATAIADILGGTAQMAACDEQKIAEEAVAAPPADGN